MSSVLAKGTVRALMRQPRALPGALRGMVAMAPIGWWKRAPFLPLPDKTYWQFRLETINGGAGDQPPSPAEVVAVARWLPLMRRLRR